MLGNLFDMKKKKIKIPLYFGELVIVRGKMKEIAKKYDLNCEAFEAVVWRDEKKKYLKLFEKQQMSCFCLFQIFLELTDCLILFCLQKANMHVDSRLLFFLF